MRIVKVNSSYSVLMDYKKEEMEAIIACLGYNKKIGARNYYGHYKQKTEIRHMIKSGRFLSGLTPRIIKYCALKNIKCEFLENVPLPAAKEVSLLGITLREDQIDLLYKIGANQRGVIKAPTGSGKTVLAGAICSAWANSNVLFLCHTLDLLEQTAEEFRAWGLSKVIVLGGGAKPILDKSLERKICIATMQTFVRLLRERYSGNFFDIIIIDEAHHLSSEKGTYAKILNQLDAPMKIGLTATPPVVEENKLILEGYLGEQIGEFTVEEGIKAGVLARPIIDLLPVPYSDKIADLYSYKEIYSQGIINNRARNLLILKEAVKAIEQDLSVLILTGKEIEHGYVLQKIAREVFDLEIPFMHGSVKKEDRLRLKESLELKETKCLVANVVWFEGINIQSLNVIINAGGGKGATGTMQKIGRGLRATEGKKTVRVIDFLDPYKALAYHVVARLTVYAEEKWLRPIV